MPDAIAAELRARIAAILAAKGEPRAFGDDEALFTSGLMDSLAATEIMMMLEADHGVDTTDDAFDIMRIDTLAGMVGVIEETKARASSKSPESVS